MATFDLIGCSAKFRLVLDQINMVAPVDSAVLVQGETGTGKEVIARAIHEASTRRRESFHWPSIARRFPAPCSRANCLVMNAAPSPARWLRPWDAFNQRTVEHCFLMKSEICLSNCNQSFSGRFKKNNSSAWVAAAPFKSTRGSLRLATRICGAWYRNGSSGRISTIGSMCFRLVYRPCGNEKRDHPILVEHFVQKFAKRQGKSIDSIPDEVMEALKRHDWPGNVRELQNVIERAVIMTTGPVLKLQTRGLITQNLCSAPPRTLEDAERAHITKTLRETSWVVGGRRGAAAKLGLARTTLIAMMRRLGISRQASGRRVGDLDRSFDAAPSDYSDAFHNTPRETAFEINSRLNKDSAANFRHTEQVSART